MAVSAELAQQHRAALLIRLEAVLPEVHVQALHIADTLIMPA